MARRESNELDFSIDPKWALRRGCVASRLILRFAPDGLVILADFLTAEEGVGLGESRTVLKIDGDSAAWGPLINAGRRYESPEQARAFVEAGMTLVPMGGPMTVEIDEDKAKKILDFIRQKIAARAVLKGDGDSFKPLV